MSNFWSVIFDFPFFPVPNNKDDKRLGENDGELRSGRQEIISALVPLMSWTFCTVVFTTSAEGLGDVIEAIKGNVRHGDLGLFLDDGRGRGTALKEKIRRGDDLKVAK